MSQVPHRGPARLQAGALAVEAEAVCFGGHAKSAEPPVGS